MDGACSSAAAISQRMRWPSESCRIGVSSTDAIFKVSTSRALVAAKRAGSTR